MKQYKAKQGARISDEDAKIIGAAIEKIAPDGFVTEEVFLDSAKDMDSPIHKYFEWDDAKAAYGFRVAQARSLIRSIVITVEGQGEVRAFHNVYVADTDERQYVSLEQALEAPALWKQVIQGALREADNWARRYKIYNELSPIVKAIEETKQNLTKETTNENETSN